MKRAAAEISALAAGLILLALAIFNAPATKTDPATLRATDSGHYHVLSDASPDEIRHLIQTLTDLHAQFRQEFAGLLDAGRHPATIQVLFFNHEADYRDYVRRVAPALAGSDGCFLSAENRLAVLNQTGRARQPLDLRQARLAPSGDSACLPRVQAAAQLREWRDTMAGQARASTEWLLRHEGAHQLFHAYRIESRFPVEPAWLTEGLAQYCEPSQLGAPHEPLLETLRQARAGGALIPLAALLNHRDPAGFFAWDQTRRDLAYAESWALVWWLMQRHRQGLFDLLQHYRRLSTPAAANAELQRDPAATLAGFLMTDLAGLEADWLAFLQTL